MTAISKILMGAAGAVALAGAASPAAAQYYPQQPYGNQGGGVVGAIINSVVNGGRYGQYPYGNYGYNQGYNGQSSAIDQCARAVESRLSGRSYGNFGYQNYGYNGYSNNTGGRVMGITRVDRKSYGLRVYGVASSGYNRYDGYNRGGYGTYGYSQGADLSFNCKVDYRGGIRDLRVSRRNADWRGY